MFVLDSSASEGSSNFHKQLDFVRDFVYQFNIGPKDVQVCITDGDSLKLYMAICLYDLFINVGQ